MYSSERTKAELFYADLLAEAKEKKQARPVMAELGRRDLWFLLVHLCNQRHSLRYPEYGQDWLFERCREVQAEPDGHLDLWAREHFKSGRLKRQELRRQGAPRRSLSARGN